MPSFCSDSHFFLNSFGVIFKNWYTWHCAAKYLQYFKPHTLRFIIYISAKIRMRHSYACFFGDDFLEIRDSINTVKSCQIFL